MRCVLCPKKIDPARDEFEEVGSCEFGHRHCVEEQERKQLESQGDEEAEVNAREETLR